MPWGQNDTGVRGDTMKRGRLLLRKCLAMALGTFLLAGSSIASAKAERMQANWVPDVYTISSDRDGLLQSAGVKQKICQALTDELKSLQAQKKLPFEVKFSNDVQANAIQDDYSDTSSIGLVPIVLMDDAFTTHYHVGVEDVYKALVTSSLGIAVCSTGADANESWRVLTILPLNSYTIIGADAKHMITSPITRQQEADAYADITVNMIKNHLDFSSTKKVLKNWEEKQMTPETYQVVDVGISSKKAQQVFHGHDIEIRNIIGNFYTEAFQKKNGCVMLPPGTSAAYAKDVTAGLYAMQLRSDNGERTFEMAKPKHEINLDFSGANWAEVQRKDPSGVRKDVAYKAWLTETRNGQKRTEDAYDVQMYLEGAGKGNSVDVDAKDIYTKVLIGLADRMGKQGK